MRRLALAGIALFLAASAIEAQTNKKIVVTGLSPNEVRELQAAAPNARIVAATSAQLPMEIQDADAVLGRINADLLRAGKRLKWAQIYSAGAEGALSSAEVRNSALTLTNCKILQGPNIADHAMALLLALTRDLNRAIPARAAEHWGRGEYHPVELRGKTAVVVGVGGIGMQIAQRASGFGMRVIGVDPKDISYTTLLAKTVPPDRLDSVLPEADVVFISAPLTRESEGMMGAREFELMKPNSYFIAVSRGRLYNTDALVRALDGKRLAGAGLDVTNPEPLPKGHPLWKFENVIITPHMAGQSDHVQERRMDLLKENVRRFVNGEQLLNVVDKQKGY